MRFGPALLITRRKLCAKALSFGAGPCRNPSAGFPVEGFLAFVREAGVYYALIWNPN